MGMSFVKDLPKTSITFLTMTVNSHKMAVGDFDRALKAFTMCPQPTSVRRM